MRVFGRIFAVTHAMEVEISSYWKKKVDHDAVKKAIAEKRGVGRGKTIWKDENLRIDSDEDPNSIDPNFHFNIQRNRDAKLDVLKAVKTDAKIVSCYVEVAKIVDATSSDVKDMHKAFHGVPKEA